MNFKNFLKISELLQGLNEKIKDLCLRNCVIDAIKVADIAVRSRIFKQRHAISMTHSVSQ